MMDLLQLSQHPQQLPQQLLLQQEVKIALSELNFKVSNLLKLIEKFQAAKLQVEKLVISPSHTLAIPTMSVWSIMEMIGAELILDGVYALVLAMQQEVSRSYTYT